MKILVFVRNEKVVLANRARKLYEHPCVNTSSIATWVENVIPPKDEELLNAAMKIAAWANAKLEIVDVNTLLGKLKAKLKGVRRYPAVVVQGRAYYNLEDVLKTQAFELESFDTS